MTEYFDEAVYQRALASGESEKSARSRATIMRNDVKSKLPVQDTSQKVPVEVNDTDDIPYKPRMRTLSEYVWAELFLLLRWVVAAVVIIVIAILITSPHGVPPTC